MSRFVARRYGEHLAIVTADKPPSVVPPPPAAALPAAALPEGPRPMTKKNRIRHTKEVIDGVLARLGAGETGATVSRDTGISQATISLWKKAANKTKRSKTPAAPLAAATNGHAKSEAPPAHEDSPSIQLTGLRAWVKREVQAELKRIFGGAGAP